MAGKIKRDKQRPDGRTDSKNNCKLFYARD